MSPCLVICQLMVEWWIDVSADGFAGSVERSRGKPSQRPATSASTSTATRRRTWSYWAAC